MLHSPTGPKTTHFWGPVANWGFVAAVSGPSLNPLLHLPLDTPHAVWPRCESTHNIRSGRRGDGVVFPPGRSLGPRI
jgi:hypothetical protein